MKSDLALRGTSLAAEFSCELGDPRRTRRLQRVAEAMSEKPELSVPDLLTDPAELEAGYRLFRNEHVDFDGVIEGHVASTAKRCAGPERVLVVHDTTEFAFDQHGEHLRTNLSLLRKKRQGFYGHVSIAVSADGLRAPLGLLACTPYVHRSQIDAEGAEFWEKYRSFDGEGGRWADAIEATERRLGGCARAIHVCDREADRNDVLLGLTSQGRGFVIRVFQRRRGVDGRPAKDIVHAEEVLARRQIELSERPVDGRRPRDSFPARKRRKAEVSIRACATELRTDKGAMVQVHLVEVFEDAPPDDEAPVHWVLMTSEPIETVEDVLLVVDMYRSRWLVEEYFKAIKTGCAYSKRQLESAQTLLVVLGITTVLAWQLLALRHLSRHQTGLPASAVVSDLQLQLLIASTPKLKWTRSPTVQDVARGVARLGGHHRTNGPPGWQVLGRGLRKLWTMTGGVLVAMEAGLVIKS